jgi:urease accessory protein
VSTHGPSAAAPRGRNGSPETPPTRDPDELTSTRRVGRDGWLRLGVERRGSRSVVVRCASAVPLQVLAPVALDDRAVVVSMLNPTGGLVGGDRLAIEVEVGPGAHACLTTPSATKVYRTAGGPAVQDVTLRLARDAVLEWVPDHTIPFAGCAFRQVIAAEVGEGARLVLVDAFAAGRVVRGEAWRFSHLESSLSVRDAGGWVLHDRFVLRGGDGPWDALGLAESHPYFASVVVSSDEGLAGFAEAVAEVAGPGPGRVGVGRLPRRGVVIRCLAPSAPALDAIIQRVWSAARCHALGAPPLSLRKP